MGVDLAGILGDAWTAPKVGRCRVEWGTGRGAAPQPTRGLGERRELPRRGPGQSPGRKRNLSYYEGHRTLLFAPI